LLKKTEIDKVEIFKVFEQVKKYDFPPFWGWLAWFSLISLLVAGSSECSTFLFDLG